jgi:hypothetical protein
MVMLSTDHANRYTPVFIRESRSAGHRKRDILCHCVAEERTVTALKKSGKQRLFKKSGAKAFTILGPGRWNGTGPKSQSFFASFGSQKEAFLFSAHLPAQKRR